MTPKNKPEFADLGGPDLVYVREIRGADLMKDADVDVTEDVIIHPDQILYAVHGADGERLAVMLDRETAFAAAEAHELDAVSVH